MSYQSESGPGPMRSGWNVGMMLRRGVLTDRKIARYQKLGWYDPSFKAARKEMMEKRRVKRALNQAERDGNFVRQGDRLIYSP